MEIMKIIMKNVYKVLLLFMLIVIADNYSNVVAAELMPTGEENVVAGDTGYWHIGVLERSRLYATDKGYVRLCYSDGKTLIEQYDDELNIVSKIRIDKQLDFWGGVCYYDGMIYVVESNYVEAEGPDSLIIRVSRYDMSGSAAGYAEIKRNASYAFARSLDVYGYNGKIYIASDQSATGHTGLIFIEVDTNTMTGRVVANDLWHSFKQYITADDAVYLQELSEGSRGVSLSKLTYNEKSGVNTISQKAIIYNYGGVRTSPLAIPCKADVNGLACSANNVITVGESIDQSRYDEVNDIPWNLYITVTPKDNIKGDKTTVKWLTDYKDAKNDVYASSITKISDDRFLVAWENHQFEKEPVAADVNDALSWGDFHYVFIDGEGNVNGREYTASIPISDCQPVFKNGKVVFYSSIGNMVNFYIIDANDGGLIKKSYRVAGEYATWEIKNDTLVLSGNGNIDIASEHHWVRDDQWGVYWNPIFGSVSKNNKIKKIIIKKGITSISDNSINNFDDVKEVYIENGIKTIGDDNLTDCDNLRNVYIPKSVKTIGKDFGWTGSYYVSSGNKVIDLTINAVKGAYAIKYAKKNKIDYKTIPAAIKLNKIVRNSKKITIKWKPIKKVTGYQIQYSTDRDFVLNTKTVKVKGYKSSKKVISKLKSKKTYYVRVRSYKNKYMDEYVYNTKKKAWKVKKVLLETIYGEWSDVKIVK